MGKARAQDIMLPTQAPDDAAPGALLSPDEGQEGAAAVADPFVVETTDPLEGPAGAAPAADGWGTDVLLAGLIILLIMLALAAARIFRLTESLRVVHEDELVALSEARELRRMLSDLRETQTESLGQHETRMKRLEEAALRERDELQRTNRLLQGMVRCDSVTGLANGSYLIRQLAKELRRAMRTRRAISILAFDIDGFDRYNQTLGHDQGDELLKRVGALLGSQFQRGGDLVARLEADRFIAVMPETPREAVLELAAKTIEQLALEAIPFGETGEHVRLSWGIASAESNKLVHPQQLLAEAGEALAQSRRPPAPKRTRKPATTTRTRKPRRKTAATRTGTRKPAARKTAAANRSAKATVAAAAAPTGTADAAQADAGVAAMATGTKAAAGTTGARTRKTAGTTAAASRAKRSAAASRTAASEPLPTEPSADAEEAGANGTLFPEHDAGRERAAGGS